MKKTLILATCVIVAMASCTKEIFVGQTQDPTQTPIAFGNANSALTKAASEPTSKDYAEKLGNSFVVYGWKVVSGTPSVVFDHYNIKFIDGKAGSTETNLNGWEYVAIDTVNATGETVVKGSGFTTVKGQSIKFWDNSAAIYKFIAFSRGKGYDSNYAEFSAIDSSKVGTDDPVYSISGKSDVLAAAYIANLDSVKPTSYKRTEPVTPTFKSVGAKIRVAFYETVPGYSVKSLKFFNNDNTASSDNKVLLYIDGEGSLSEKGSLNVYIDKKGVATAKFNADSGADAVKTLQFEDSIILNKGKEFYEKDISNYMGRTSSSASYSHAQADSAYLYQLPNSGVALNVKVKYTLISTDGRGEEIEVGPVTATIPAQYTNWQSNYAYTYIFKISEKSGNLEPITFDAVVTDTQEGNQETITTVADSTLTTYAKDVNPTSNDEYAVGSNIYVSLKNPGKATLTTSNTALYTVTVESGACQGITEASVANCLATATGNSGIWTVTDANGKNLTVTEVSGNPTIVTEIATVDAPDGKAVSGNFAKIASAVAGTYAFEYTAEDGVKSYKIIVVE